MASHLVSLPITWVRGLANEVTPPRARVVDLSYQSTFVSWQGVQNRFEKIALLFSNAVF
jgi:hypothetical protein